MAETFLEVAGAAWLDRLFILRRGDLPPKPLVEVLGSSARLWMTDVTLKVPMLLLQND